MDERFPNNEALIIGDHFAIARHRRIGRQHVLDGLLPES
jgi:hypothetical protein